MLQTFSHDPLGRLTGAGGGTQGTQSWTYDGNGNLLSAVGSSGTTSYSYGSSGPCALPTASALPNELAGVTRPGPATTCYSYDSNDQRLQTAGISESLGYASQGQLIACMLKHLPHRDTLESFVAAVCTLTALLPPDRHPCRCSLPASLPLLCWCPCRRVLSSFPLSGGHGRADTAQEASTETCYTQAKGGHMMARVALLYNDPLFLELLHTRHTGDGYEALSCTEEGQAACRRVRTFDPHAIVLDLPTEVSDRRMRLLDLLSRDAQLAAVPVILCTGVVRHVEEHVATLQGPPCVILAKPYEVDDLLRLLHQVIDRAE